MHGENKHFLKFFIVIIKKKINVEVDHTQNSRNRWAVWCEGGNEEMEERWGSVPIKMLSFFQLIDSMPQHMKPRQFCSSKIKTNKIKTRLKVWFIYLFIYFLLVKLFPFIFVKIISIKMTEMKASLFMKLHHCKNLKIILFLLAWNWNFFQESSFVSSKK